MSGGAALLAEDPSVSAIARLRDFREWAPLCYRIRTQKGELRPLRMRRAQEAIVEEERRLLRERGHARIFLLKARRAGFTTVQQAKALHQIWSHPGFDALTLAHTGTDTFKLFEITRRAVRHFPPALLPKLGDRETTEVSFPELDSFFFTSTAGGKGPARGATLKRVHGSEFAFWEDPTLILSAVTPSMEGVPRTTIILETTASVYGSDAHLYWLAAAAGQGSKIWNGYLAKFYPWWECDPLGYRLPLEEPDELGQLADDEQLLVQTQGLDLEQIKWRRDRMAGPGGRPFFLREFAEDPDECWLKEGEGYYSTDRLKLLRLSAPVPNPALSDNEDGVLVYGEPPAGESLVLGADVAEGVGGDRSTFVVRSYPSWRLVAQYANSRVEPTNFARIIDTWGRKWTPAQPAFLVVEKNGHGITVLRALRDAHRYPTHRIYRRKPLDEERDEQTDKLGWVTSGGQHGTYPILLSAGFELFAAAAGGFAQPPSVEAIQDGFSVVTGKNGKISLTGRDVLVAEMLAWIGRADVARKGSFWVV